MEKPRPVESGQKLSAACGLVLLAVAAVAVAQTASQPSTSPAVEGVVFPTNLQIEGRLDSFNGRTLQEQMLIVQETLRLAAACEATVKRSPRTVRSAWSWVDDALMSQAIENLAPLAAQQQNEAAKDLLTGTPRESIADVMTLYRRWPLAGAVHAAMLDAAERGILQGQTSLARRLCADVLAHASDAALRDRAQAGVWLTMLLEPPAVAEQEFRGASLDKAYMWFGAPTKAAAIRDQVLAAAQRFAARAPAAEATGVGKLDASATRILQLPPTATWNVNLLKHIKGTWDPFAADDAAVATGRSEKPAYLLARGKDVLVCGAGVLACYGDDGAKPRWTAGARTPVGLLNSYATDLQERPYTVLHGPVRPAIDGGMVYTRWNLDFAGRFFRSLAAMDLRDGTMIWSTAGNSAWKDLCPVSDPTVCEGRVYVLAVPPAILPSVRVFLACADARTGALLWSRYLGSCDVMGLRYDVSHFGNSVTVKDGAVYCCSNIGFVARCDARDGVIEWATTYGRFTAHKAPQLGVRQGMAPVVVGDKVVVMPRDTAGVLCLDARTGNPLWDCLTAPSEQAGGMAGKFLVVADRSQVAGLDVSNGSVAWTRNLEQPIATEIVTAGNWLLVGTGWGVYKLSADDGAVQEKLPWGPAGGALAMTRSGGKLVCVCPQSVNDAAAAGAPLNAAAGETQAFALPVRESWRLERRYSRMFVPLPEAKQADKVLLQTGNLLEWVTASAKGAVNWRSLAENGFEPVFTDKLVILVYRTRVLALDASTGAPVWDIACSFPIRKYYRMGPYLVLGRYGLMEPEGRSTAVIDLAAGRVLWTSRFLRELGGNDQTDSFVEAGFDGQNLHLFAPRLNRTRGSDVIIRPKDGTVVEVRALDAGQQAMGFVAGDTWGCFLDIQRHVYAFDLAGKRPPAQLNVDITAQIPPSARAELSEFLSIAGPWCKLRFMSPRNDPTSVILRYDDPKYSLTTQTDGQIVGDRYFTSSGSVLSVTDLPSKRTLTYTAEADPADFGAWRDIDNYWLSDTDKKVYVLTEVLRDGPGGRRVPSHLRLEAFEAAGGPGTARQNLSDILLWRSHNPGVNHHAPSGFTCQTQSAMVNNTLLIIDPHGLHALVNATSIAGAGPADEILPQMNVPAAATPPVIDAVFDDWPRDGWVSFKDAAGNEDRVQVAFDRDNLYLAVDYAAPGASPRVGSGDYGAGDVLEVNLQGQTQVRLALGLNRVAKAVTEDWGSAEDIANVRCSLWHDPLTGRTTGEVAIPMAYVAVRQQNRNIALSLTAWKGSIGLGSGTRFTWRRQLTDVDLSPRRDRPPVGVRPDRPAAGPRADVPPGEAKTWTGAANRTGTQHRPLLVADGKRYELKPADKAGADVKETLQKIADGDTGNYSVKGTESSADRPSTILVESITKN